MVAKISLLAIGTIVLLASCGDNDSEPESEPATTQAVEVAETDAAMSDTATLEATADTTATADDDESAGDDAETVEAVPAHAGLPDDMFSSAVLPALESSCASCHAPGQAGAESMALGLASDAQTHAEDIALLAVSGAMPPWPASDLGPDYYGDHSLSAEQIASITEWAEAGAPIDVEPDMPIVSSQPTSFLSEEAGERDIVMTSAAGAYAGSPEVVDDYRCMIFEPGNTETEWILASHFEADQVEVVHHGIISLVSGSKREEAAALDAAEDGPGWTCYGGTGLGGFGGETAEVRRAGGWAPGAPPSRRPDGYATQLNPGDFFVVQVHYHYVEDAPADLSRFVLDLASDEQIAAQGGSFETLKPQLYLGPAEIPCYEGDTHPLCDRAAALERVVDLYGPVIGFLPDHFLRQCGSDPSDYTEMTDGTAWSTCDLPVVNPGRIMSVTGHMHELGLSIRLTLNPDTDEERVLLDIPDWDFEWQLGYAPIEDIIIDADDVIRVDCAWNRERAPYEAVGYILWADGTGDEMCYSNITTAPVD